MKQDINENNPKVMIISSIVFTVLMIFGFLKANSSDTDMIANMILVLIVVLLFVVIAILIKNKGKLPFMQQEVQSMTTLKETSTQPGNQTQPENILPLTSNLRFSDVAGINDVKEELEEIVDFLTYPAKYKKHAIKLPKGVLLVGPPGVGKTLIAKALAGEADVPFFYQSGASFVHMYVGVGAQKVKELFAKAKANAPAIVFIDEIDAVGKERGTTRSDERDATLNQLLTEMDGFEDSSGVIVVAATNKIDVLDPALLRAGRFDRRVFVSLPNQNEREDILKLHLKGQDVDVDYSLIAKETIGFNGASLATLVNEAALLALKKMEKISTSHLLSLKDKVLVGKKRQQSFSDEDKKLLATYQAAKALCIKNSGKYFDRVYLTETKIQTIDKEICSYVETIKEISCLLSGHVALEVLFGNNYSISKNDLDEARALSVKAVKDYGVNGLFSDAKDSEKLTNDLMRELKLEIASNEENIIKTRDMLLEKESLGYDEIL